MAPGCGGIADGTTVARAESCSDPARHLANHDSYHFFERLGDLLKTGPTNTNVMDVRLLLVEKSWRLSLLSAIWLRSVRR
jgi:glycerate-2-kinase